MFGTSVVNPNKQSIISDIDETDKNKYSIFHLYKWTTIFYQMALVYELIVVPLYWTIVFPAMIKNLDLVENPDEKINQKG